MKKSLLKLLCLCAVMILVLPCVNALAITTGYNYVKTDNGKSLNVRTDASKNGEVICQLPYGETVLISQFNRNHTWAYIEATNPKNSKQEGPTVKGWVMTSFLSATKPKKYEPTDPDEPGKNVFNDINSAAKAIKYLDEPYLAAIKTKNPANYVHLRWFPSTDANYIEKFLCDTVIEVIAESKTWAQIRIMDEDTPAYVGFILKSNVAALGE